ncbi:PRC-barrel domain-containing protein [Patescibacteria group bacterium]|nr:PRC-barrel domain-containing protein [Patescibacteria group bacterium]MBU1683497.1 PRC-barrel domain-containing protein [Patescibacteria group bacterium]
MINDYKSIIGTPILDFDDGNPLAMLKDVIIDPDTGKIEAFWVKPLTILASDAVIQSQDIVEWKKNIYVKDDSVIADPADIIRISDILSRATYIIGNRVQNEEGEFYGRVYNIDFDTETFYLKQIYVEKSILGLISLGRRIFSFDSIVEVLPGSIIVKDKATKKEKIIKTNLIEDPSVT